MGQYFAEHGISPIAMVGMVLALVGVSFKIAAVPMHFYTADVYQGASSSMAAFLAFVPKTAGIISILLLVSTMGWAVGSQGGGETLPPVIDSLLWAIAVLTMTVGNVLAVLQKSIKRMLAYSSIAHSGYMLVGIITGPGDGSFTSSGLSAVLFYLLVYGVTNTGAFAVLACLERSSHGETVEAEDIGDLRGLCKTNPWLGWSMVLCMLSLLGFPPILGFFGKVPLFTSALGAGRVTLVVILGINSAIAAFYYLRVVATVMLEEPADTGVHDTGVHDTGVHDTGVPSRVLGAVVSGVCVVAFSIFTFALFKAVRLSARILEFLLPRFKFVYYPALFHSTLPQLPYPVAYYLAFILPMDVYAPTNTPVPTSTTYAFSLVFDVWMLVFLLVALSYWTSLTWTGRLHTYARILKEKDGIDIFKVRPVASLSEVRDGGEEVR